MRGLAMAGLLIAPPALAAPPPTGSEDYLLTAPYGAWFGTLRNAEGAPCCTLSDCRPAEARIANDGHRELADRA